MDINVIKPLIQQHARDAVFYWQQINITCFSPLVTSQKRRHFHRQMNAHLDGLRAAGSEGWNAAFNNYLRWKSEGEAFVCWLLALGENNSLHIDALQKMALNNLESSLRGMTEAIIWLPKNQAITVLTLWRQEALLDEHKLEAWLRAAGLAGIVPDETLSPILAHINPRIRSACCELVGKLRLDSYQTDIIALLSDDIASVREKATLALAWLTPQIDIVDEMYSLMSFHLQHAPSRGLEALIVKRKLEYMARITGLCLNQGDHRLEAILAELPERLGIIMMAYHGNPIHLPLLYKAMDNENTARLAFWAIGFISGLDMTQPENYRSEPEITENEEPPLSFRSDDVDTGLIWPNVATVMENCRSLNLPGGPLILGETPSTTRCQELLSTENQAIRFAAAWHFAKNNKNAHRIDTRF